MAYRPVVAPPPGAPPMMMFTQPSGSAAASGCIAQGLAALLLSCNGADGSTTLTDSSQFARTVSVFGAAQLDTAQAKFGASSLLLVSTNDYLTVTPAETWWPASVDFTAELFMRPITTTKTMGLIGTRKISGASTIGGWRLVTDPAGVVTLVAWDAASNVTVNIVGASTFSANVWSHVAMSREAGTWRLFLNGVLQGSATAAHEPHNVIHIGRDAGFTTRDFEGHLDDIRVWVGDALYTANFTPPTVALTA